MYLEKQQGNVTQIEPITEIGKICTIKTDSRPDKGKLSRAWTIIWDSRERIVWLLGT